MQKFGFSLCCFACPRIAGLENLLQTCFGHLNLRTTSYKFLLGPLFSHASKFTRFDVAVLGALCKNKRPAHFGATSLELELMKFIYVRPES